MDQNQHGILPDTVYALASAPGRAGVAVVRLSGPHAGSVWDALTHKPRPAPRIARLVTLRHPETHEVLDQALALWFTAPASFTGEDVLELHLHGGRAVLAGVLDALARLPGLKMAEPGAFTRRAFENGKMDLTEAEAMADLIDAETAAQKRQALRQMDGALGELYHGWAARLTQILAHIEAAIDFVDEDDLPEDLAQTRRDDLRALLADMMAHLNDHGRGEKIRTGFTVVLLGAPNAGKSSLLNALAAREAAIVTPLAGTTRDVIEVPLDIGGYPVTLMDTAGLRETGDVIEGEGVRRAKERADKADIKILLFDGTAQNGNDIETENMATGGDARAVLRVVNKADLIAPSAPRRSDALYLSAKTGTGVMVLADQIAALLAQHFDTLHSPAITRARHREALVEAAGHIGRALGTHEVELCAEDVRLAMRALGRITGSVDVEDLLDVIFSSFCLGK